jgi:hypothetical protein
MNETAVFILVTICFSILLVCYFFGDESEFLETLTNLIGSTIVFIGYALVFIIADYCLFVFIWVMLGGK